MTALPLLPHYLAALGGRLLRFKAKSNFNAQGARTADRIDPPAMIQNSLYYKAPDMKHRQHGEENASRCEVNFH
ncbi:MAG: hypothetical protein JWP25_2271 [Bradyrhizobium sp.]|jgi:hypothetical protein|nr:hypothetical protein [Bradyrhizobium sp.]MEA2867650.1 hypothetical protein [Bradyrhizobium sp.]